MNIDKAFDTTNQEISTPLQQCHMLLELQMCWASKILTEQVKISNHLPCEQVGNLILCQALNQSILLLEVLL